MRCFRLCFRCFRAIDSTRFILALSSVRRFSELSKIIVVLISCQLLFYNFFGRLLVEGSYTEAVANLVEVDSFTTRKISKHHYGEYYAAKPELLYI